MMLEQELRVAVNAVRQACRVCTSVRTSLDGDQVLDKSDRSPVTIADFGSQAVICRALSREFPSDPIVAEEGSAELRDERNARLLEHVVAAVAPVWTDDAIEDGDILEAIDKGNVAFTPERYWTLDPIDGTKGFLRNDQYAVALALVENGNVVLGVLGCPNLWMRAGDDRTKGCLFYATAGDGAFVKSLAGDHKAAIHVSGTTRPQEAIFCEPFEPGHSAHDASAAVAGRLGIVKPPVRMDSQCKYAAVARGDASVYMRLPTHAEYAEKIWDHAAGCIVIREAGGRVTDITGRTLDFTRGRTLRRNQGILATNGVLHGMVLDELADEIKK